MDSLDFDGFRTRIDDGTLTRGEWVGTDARGRETACALAALWPATGKEQSPDACPAALLPPWLAHLIPWLDDADIKSPVDVWLARMRRLAEVLPSVVELSPEALDRLRNRVGIVIVREAVSHVTTDEWGIRAACDGVSAALESGDKEQIAAWEAAEAAAGAAEAEAAWEAAWAARAAAEATWAAMAARARASAERRLADAIISEMKRAVAEMPSGTKSRASYDQSAGRAKRKAKAGAK